MDKSTSGLVDVPKLEFDIVEIEKTKNVYEQTKIVTDEIKSAFKSTKIESPFKKTDDRKITAVDVSHFLLKQSLTIADSFNTDRRHFTLFVK